MVVLRLFVLAPAIGLIYALAAWTANVGNDTRAVVIAAAQAALMVNVATIFFSKPNLWQTGLTLATLVIASIRTPTALFAALAFRGTTAAIVSGIT